MNDGIEFGLLRKNKKLKKCTFVVHFFNWLNYIFFYYILNKVKKILKK